MRGNNQLSPVDAQSAQSPQVAGEASMGNGLGTSAAFDHDALFGEHYRELRRMARGRMRQSGELTLLDTTSLVNELYVKLSSSDRQKFQSREHFLAYASTAMRSIIVDAARARAWQSGAAGCQPT